MGSPTTFRCEEGMKPSLGACDGKSYTPSGKRLQHSHFKSLSTHHGLMRWLNVRAPCPPWGVRHWVDRGSCHATHCQCLERHGLPVKRGLFPGSHLIQCNVLPLSAAFEESCVRCAPGEGKSGLPRTRRSRQQRNTPHKVSEGPCRSRGPSFPPL